MLAGVDQSIRRSTRKPRLNQDENMWTKSLSMDGEVVAMLHGVEQLLAHPHQRGGAAGREIEPAQQLLPARLGRGDAPPPRWHRTGSRARLDRGVEPRMVGAEARGQRLEEGDTRAGGQLGVACEDLAGERHAGGFAAARQELLAELDQARRALLGGSAAVASGRSARGRDLRCVCSMSPKKEVFTGCDPDRSSRPLDR